MMNVLDFDNIIVFLLALLGGGTLIATLFNLFKIPTQIGFILSGIMIGPYGLKIIESSSYSLIVSEISAVLLMFCIGLEFSVSKLKSFRKDFLILGPVQVLATVTIVTAISYFLMNQNLINAILWGILISLSSTALIFKFLKDARKDKTIYGSTSIAILLFQDLAVIPAILLINFWGNQSLDQENNINIIGFVRNNIVLFGSIFIFKRWLIPFLLEKVARTSSRELFYYSTFLLCFGISYFSHSLGLSYSVGAFIAGLIIAESPYGRHALAEFSSLRDNFLGIFFMTIGMLVSPVFIYHNIPRISIYVILIILIKCFVIYLLMRILKKPKNISIIVSMVLAQVGEFSFILATLAFQKKIIAADDFQLFMCLSIVSLILTPVLFKYIPLALRTFGFSSRGGSELTFGPVKDRDVFQDLVLIIGFGHMGEEIVRELQSIGTPFKIIEQNYNTYSKYRRDIPIYYGNASQFEMLNELELDNIKLAIICINNPVEVEVIVKNLRKINPLIKIIIRVNYIIEEGEFSQNENLSIVTSEREVTKNMILKVRDFFNLDPS